METVIKLTTKEGKVLELGYTDYTQSAKKSLETLIDVIYKSENGIILEEKEIRKPIYIPKDVFLNSIIEVIHSEKTLEDEKIEAFINGDDLRLMNEMKQMSIEEKEKYQGIIEQAIINK